MTQIVGGFSTLAFNEGAFNARGGRLSLEVPVSESTVAVAVLAGDADSTTDRIWLKPEPTVYIPRECVES